MSIDLPEVHAKALEHTHDIVAAIRPEQLRDPTPCEGWDVRTLLHHVVYGNLWVAPLVGGETIAEVGDRLEGEILGDDFVAAYDRSAAEAAAAFRRDGAMAAPCAVSYGPVPGQVYCGHRLIDVLVHGWDLAEGTNGDTVLPPDLVEACIEVTAPQAEQLGASGAFGTGVTAPEGASGQTRLLAMLGRHG